MRTSITAVHFMTEGRFAAATRKGRIPRSAALTMEACPGASLVEGGPALEAEAASTEEASTAAAVAAGAAAAAVADDPVSISMMTSH
jgi:hypothetical protein